MKPLAWLKDFLKDPVEERLQSWVETCENELNTAIALDKQLKNEREAEKLADLYLGPKIC